MSMKLDMSKYSKNMNALLKNQPEAAIRILTKTGDAVIRDANKEEPRTPKDKGFLRSKTLVIMVGRNSAAVFFTQPQAHRWHEAIGNIDPVTGGKITWTDAGSGPKFLESKIVRFRSKYLELMARLEKNEIKNVISS